ncbi:MULTISPECIES: M23 family metallopeptidase [Bacteria]|uniref:M23 family metallopeptidase n=1 Tax=Bacteria TaxID=2 RepID=UPI003C7B98A4
MAAQTDTNAKTPEERPLTRSTRGEKQGKATRNVVKPVRSIAIFGAVGALVTAIALPAFASGAGQGTAPTTMQQIASENSQSLVVASEATTAPVARDSFTATTQEEIDKKKAEEAAAARAAAAAAAASAATASSGGRGSVSSIDLSMTAPGSGEVRYPVTNFTSGEGPGSGRGHQGWDMIAPQGTPIFAAAAGRVVVSQESYGGYGVAIDIEHVIGGQKVLTRYGHMVYGSRVVQVGDTVAAGQVIGQVGNTGNSYGAHLHFEVHIGGGIVDPQVWLAANAG